MTWGYRLRLGLQGARSLLQELDTRESVMITEYERTAQALCEYRGVAPNKVLEERRE